MSDADTERLKAEIEELRRRSRELQESLDTVRDEFRSERENHRELIEGLPLYVFKKDTDLRHFDVSPNLARRLGRTLAEVAGRMDTDLSPGLGDKYQKDDRMVMQTGRVFEDIEEHNPVDGEPTYIQTRKMPLHDAKGNVVGVQGWFFDVTPLKSAELALQGRTRELEDAVGQLRNNQEQLMVAEKMASLGRLTAGIAHEMNTPLAAVRSALSEVGELVSEYKRSIGDEDVSNDDHNEIAADMDKSLTLAKNAAARAAAFVRGIKSHTRNVTTVLAIDFDVAEVIQESLLLVNHAARQHNVELVFVSEIERAIISGVPGRLGQVVNNLITNAIDASRDRSPARVTVRLSREGEAGTCLSVEDLGVGIPVHMQKKIFEPMFTTKPFGEGTGLGLSIVSDIVAGEFGGHVDLTSETGVGTTFRVHLGSKKPPLAAVADDRSDPV